MQHAFVSHLELCLIVLQLMEFAIWPKDKKGNLCNDAQETISVLTDLFANMPTGAQHNSGIIGIATDAVLLKLTIACANIEVLSVAVQGHSGDD